MKTTMHIKVDKDIKDKSADLASRLGLSLSTIVNASLRNFIKTETFSVSAGEEMTPYMASWMAEIEKDKKASKNISGPFNSIAKLKTHLSKRKVTPPLMGARHACLNKIYNIIVNNPEKIKELFDFNKTTHADLDLSWINIDFQEKEIGEKNDYQIVVATVQPQQKSKGHLHEIGSSSFIVLGQKNNLNEPKNLTFRTGKIEYPSGDIKLNDDIKCYEGLELDIPSNTVHQFINESDEPNYLLIVTHPIISVEEGHEDTHFVM